MSRATTWYRCACGCGRKVVGSYTWDGYHGPDFTKPIMESEDEPWWLKLPQRVTAMLVLGLLGSLFVWLIVVVWRHIL